MSLGKSDSKQSSEFDQNVFENQIPFLEDLYGSAGDMFSQLSGNLPGQSEFGRQNQENTINALQNPWLNQMGGGAYQDMGLQSGLMKSLSQSLGNPSAMQDINSMIMGGDGNNYVDAMKQSYVTDANTASQNMLANLDARAAGSGMSGGARQGIAQAQGFKDINTNLQRNLAQTGYGAFDKDLDRKLKIAQQADQNTFGRQQLMSNMIGQQQDTANQGINYGGNMLQYGNNQQLTPWQMLGQYKNVIGDPEVLSSGSSSGSGSAFGLDFSSLAGGGGKKG